MSTMFWIFAQSFKTAEVWRTGRKKCSKRQKERSARLESELTFIRGLLTGCACHYSLSLSLSLSLFFCSTRLRKNPAHALTMDRLNGFQTSLGPTLWQRQSPSCQGWGWRALSSQLCLQDFVCGWTIRLLCHVFCPFLFLLEFAFRNLPRKLTWKLARNSTRARPKLNFCLNVRPKFFLTRPKISPRFAPEVFKLVFEGVWDSPPPQLHIKLHTKHRPIFPTRAAGVAHSPGPLFSSTRRKSRTARIRLLGQPQDGTMRLRSCKKAGSLWHKYPGGGVIESEQKTWTPNQIRTGPALTSTPVRFLLNGNRPGQA